MPAVNANEYRGGIIQRWNNFEARFQDQILILMVSKELERENYELMITLKKAIDTTHAYVERAFSGDPKLSLLDEEYKLIKVMFSLLQEYSPKVSHENLAALYSELNNTIAHRKRL